MTNADVTVPKESVKGVGPIEAALLKTFKTDGATSYVGAQARLLDELCRAFGERGFEINFGAGGTIARFAIGPRYVPVGIVNPTR